MQMRIIYGCNKIKKFLVILEIILFEFLLYVSHILKNILFDFSEKDIIFIDKFFLIVSV